MFAAGKTKGAVAAGPSTDPQFDYVTMLLHGDGTNGAQNNTFIDSSTNNFTITRNGTPTQGSFSPYGPNWSNYFSSTSGQYLTIANNAAFTLGSTFTVECWIYRTTNDDGTIVGRWYDTTSAAWLMHIYASGRLAFGLGTGSFADYGSTTIPLNTWTHLAVSNDATSKRLYVNGVLDGTFTSDNVSTLGTQNLTISQNTGGGYGLPAYISNLRIVKGTALYNSNFTPSTTPLTAVSGTSLLTCQSNRFIDNSSNNFTLTVSGSPSVQRFSPFAPSAAYSTATIGGSGSFGPSGISNLRILPTGLSSMSTWTIEFWAYNSTGQADQAILGPWGPNLIRDSNGSFQVYLAGGSKFNTSWTKNQWNHVALCNDGTSLRLYINGAQVSSTSSVTIDLSTMVIGSEQTTSSSNDVWNGYISDFRVLNGTALYTGSTYTVPTSPLTAISNTKLLLNFTNGAVFDNAMMNDLQTVGNAQISTSVKKYGTGSLAFDGSGDYLIGPSTPNLAFGTGDFTVEAWVYRNTSTSSYETLFGFDISGGFLFQIFNNQLEYGIRATFGEDSGVTVPSGQWVHLALTRQSGVVYFFQDGVLTHTYSGAYATANFTNNSPVIISGYSTSAGQLNGYIDDLRITKGYARYTANFTPPAQAFPNN